MAQSKTPSQYRWRTAILRHLPWFLIDRGIAAKGADCEAVGGNHAWYHVDGTRSGCYHCEVIHVVRLWEQTDV